MDRAVLEKPFSPDLVKTRKGAFGDINYVEGAQYIRRLNEAFDGDWSWRIVSHEVRGSEVTVLGSLEAAGQTKVAFGGSSITTNRGTGEVVSVSDDLKSAATDSLKKCCSLFGIGLDLYSAATDLNEDVDAVSQAASLRAVPRFAAAPMNVSPAEKQPMERTRLTAKQLRALYAIAHGSGMTDSELKRSSIETYGVAPEFLGRIDASSLIDALSSK